MVVAARHTDSTMAHVRKVPVGEATGKLAEIYQAALQRAGKVFQILQIQSLNAESLQACMQAYMATTTSAKNSLPRWVREAIAVVVSVENHCVY